LELDCLLWLAQSASFHEAIVEWVTEYSYVGVFVILLACGLGFPCPEEVALVGGGYAVYQTHPESWTYMGLMVVVGLLGVLLGDLSIYGIGRRVGHTPHRIPLIGHHLSPKRMERARRLFQKHGAKAVFVGRFLWVFRAVTFFVSGSLRVRVSTFLFYDGLAAVLSVPACVFLGWHFGAEIEEAFMWVGRLDRVLLVLVTLAVLIFAYSLWRTGPEGIAEMFRDSSDEIDTFTPSAPDQAEGSGERGTQEVEANRRS
jgi:membrane protein DedA with SNARE-associated domain